MVGVVGHLAVKTFHPSRRGSIQAGGEGVEPGVHEVHIGELPEFERRIFVGWTSVRTPVAACSSRAQS